MYYPVTMDKLLRAVGAEVVEYPLSGVNYFFSLTTIISPYQRQLLLDC
jgi:hypothetical protein